MSASRVFAYETTRVRVEADESALDWLGECVAPQFEVEAAGPDESLHVALRNDPARHAALRARGPSPGGERIDCFAMDGRVIAHPRWSAPTGVTAFDEEFHVFYVAGPGRVEVVTDGTRPWSRVALFRVLREVVTTGCHTAGHLMVHAAAFVADGRGAIVVGAKRAGKTSLLAHALAHPAVRFLANDRAVVADGGEAPTVRGIPTIVRVRADMARFFPEVFRDCSRDPDQACWSRAEALGRPRREMPADAAVVLSPPQFVALFAAEQAAAAPLSAVAFPQVDTATTGLSVRVLAPDEAGTRLHAALFPAPPPAGLAAAVAGALPARPAATDALAQRCRRLAERVRCVECRLGPDAYAADPGARRLVEGLLG